MIRIKLLAVAFLALFMGVTLTAPPASAYITPGARISSYSGAVLVDNWVVFQKQADGTGVRITDVWLGVAAGCTSHFYQTPKWWVTNVEVYNGNTGAYVNGYSEGNWSACDRTIARGVNGPDDGFVKVVVRSGAQHPSTDLWYEWVWHLYPSGSTVLTYSGVTTY